MKRILNYVGSKWSMAQWIISHMPPHEVYLEPFFGSGAVYFNKIKTTNETINDIDQNVVNLFKVIRDHPFELARSLRFTPYSRQEYNSSFELLSEDINDIERARLFMIRCWMARGGKTSDRTGWRHNVDSVASHAVRDWSGLPERIAEVAERLRMTQIEQRAAVDLIRKYNRKDCLIYADPPYLLKTRTKRHYANEMTDEDHVELLRVLKEHKGFVLLSGYSSNLYDEHLKDWMKVERMASTEFAQRKKEVLWLNPKTAECQRQMRLF